MPGPNCCSAGFNVGGLVVERAAYWPGVGDAAGNGRRGRRLTRRGGAEQGRDQPHVYMYVLMRIYAPAGQTCYCSTATRTSGNAIETSDGESSKTDVNPPCWHPRTPRTTGKELISDRIDLFTMYVDYRDYSRNPLPRGTAGHEIIDTHSFTW